MACRAYGPSFYMVYTLDPDCWRLFGASACRLWARASLLNCGSPGRVPEKRLIDADVPLCSELCERTTSELGGARPLERPKQ